MCPKHIREDFFMKFPLLKISTFVLFAFLLSIKIAHADTAGSSAALINTNTFRAKDNRAEVLKSFLQHSNSPLSTYSKAFVEEADKNDLDWKLVVSIAGNESQFGQMIPSYSYNAWGYGVYGDNVRRFSSWNEGISVVSRALRTDYINSWGAKNIHEIGSIYAEDPLWASKVSVYISRIQEYEKQYPYSSLSISL